MAEEKKEYYTKAELEEFRILIEERLADAKKEYKRLSEALKEANDIGSDSYNITDYGDSVNKEELEYFLSRQVKFMNDLDRALFRIKNGTYGRCKITGKLISKERLRAVPHTETSIEAKMKGIDKIPPQYRDKNDSDDE